MPECRPASQTAAPSPIASSGVTDFADDAPFEPDDRDSPVIGDAETAERIAAELGAVDEALGRIEAGRYGVCTECGDRLDDDVLAADPTVKTCAAHLRLEHAVARPESSPQSVSPDDAGPAGDLTGQ